MTADGWGFGKNFEGKYHNIIEIITQHFPGENDKKKQRTAVSIACVLAEIRTEYLPNTNLDRYHYANPLSCVSKFGCIETHKTCTVLVRKARVMRSLIGLECRGENRMKWNRKIVFKGYGTSGTTCMKDSFPNISVLNSEVQCSIL
jgi:hypothetical protein